MTKMEECLLVYLHTTSPDEHLHFEAVYSLSYDCSNCKRRLGNSMHYAFDKRYCSEFCRWEAAKEMTQVLRGSSRHAAAAALEGRGPGRGGDL